MPELPDITVYCESIERFASGYRLERIRLNNPFLLRSVTPAPKDAEGRRLVATRRLGKRVVLELEGGIFIVLHLMIAGRLHWIAKGEKAKKTQGKALVAFEFDRGTLTLTEAGTKRRASMHIVAGEQGLRALDRGGIEPLNSDAAEFDRALRSQNRTLKRSLTDPATFSGIGNAYSDEILHRARLSPLQRTGQLSDAESRRLFHAARAVLEDWTERLRRQTGEEFPENVTAFRPEMAVHGKCGRPCPVCGEPIQRIVYADNECDYCANCQTGRKLLADRALSRLLKSDWPRTLDEIAD